MFRVITSEKSFAIKVLNKDRMFITYNDEMVCKYDNTKDGIKEMLDDFVGFLVEEKEITTRQQKAVMENTKLALANFAW